MSYRWTTARTKYEWYSHDLAISPKVKRRIVDDMKLSLSRARVLYDRAVLNGGTAAAGTYSPFANSDKRDLAAFIFFEVAAKFEDFCAEALLYEVRLKYEVQPGKARYILGSSDKGLTGFMGWGSPNMLSNRAEHLFGKVGYFARIQQIVGATTYLHLTHAHKVRNRVAHSGAKASGEFSKILGALTVPVGSRKGLSVGRLLCEYPATAATNDKWFYRFLKAYEKVVTEFDSRVT